MRLEEGDARIAENNKNKTCEWLGGTQESQRLQVILEMGVKGQNRQDILSSFIFLE